MYFWRLIPTFPAPWGMQLIAWKRRHQTNLPMKCKFIKPVLLNAKIWYDGIHLSFPVIDKFWFRVIENPISYPISKVSLIIRTWVLIRKSEYSVKFSPILKYSLLIFFVSLYKKTLFTKLIFLFSSTWSYWNIAGFANNSHTFEQWRCPYEQTFNFWWCWNKISHYKIERKVSKLCCMWW